MYNLLNQKCTVERNDETIDEYNTPTNCYKLVGVFPCRLNILSRADNVSGFPQNRVSERYMIYLPVKADIKEGDIVKIENAVYRTADIYKPGNHHIEAELNFEREL